MKKSRLSLWSLGLWTISVPLMLALMWVVEQLRPATPAGEKGESIIAMVLISLSFLGTGTGAVLALVSTIKEWPRGSGRPAALPLLALVLNGFCFLIWALLVIIMIGSVRAG